MFHCRISSNNITNIHVVVLGLVSVRDERNIAESHKPHMRFA